jgi:hypothetical protein
MHQCKMVTSSTATMDMIRSLSPFQPYASYRQVLQITNTSSKSIASQALVRVNLKVASKRFLGSRRTAVAACHEPAPSIKALHAFKVFAKRIGIFLNKRLPSYDHVCLVSQEDERKIAERITPHLLTDPNSYQDKTLKKSSYRSSAAPKTESDFRAGRRLCWCLSAFGHQHNRPRHDSLFCSRNASMGRLPIPANRSNQGNEMHWVGDRVESSIWMLPDALSARERRSRYPRNGSFTPHCTRCRAEPDGPK